jgi:hypothetical protein
LDAVAAYADVDGDASPWAAGYLQAEITKVPG